MPTQYRDPEERFWEKVALPDSRGCLIWTAARDRHGYGQFAFGGKGRHVQSHRFSYLRAYGEIPPGMELDHLCRIPSCVNPEHLEPVSHRENLRRAHFTVTKQRAAARTHCPQQHEYDDANTYVNRAGARECRTCGRERAAARRAADRTLPHL